MHRAACALLWLMWSTNSHAQVIVNGDWESGPLSIGWAGTNFNGGVVTVVNQATQFSALGPTTGIVFPSPTHAVNLRSGGLAPVSSVAILTSTTFLVTNESIRWSQRSESSNVDLEARILQENWVSLEINPLPPSAGAFTQQQLDVADHCGETRRVQFRQHTTQSGSAWFTLLDDIELAGPACPDFRDSDLDGYCPGGRDFNADGDCADPGEPVGAADCDDDDPAISPGAFDVPGNGLDEDCSGDFLCYEDGDGDGYGNDSAFVIPSIDPDCDQPGESLSTDDCDDLDAGTNPGAVDLAANAVDEDCDGDWACWADLDLDGFGTAAATIDSPDATCVAAGESTTTTDCDDTRPLVFPGGDDLPADGLDQDCDGDFACYADDDLDLYGSSDLVDADIACADPGASSNALDCDDRDDRVNPAAYDLPANRTDEDCDGDWACWFDGDSDGHGTSDLTIDGADDRCRGPNQSTSIDDCDDTDATIFPGADDLPADAIDQDCDGDFACFEDQDLDLYGSSRTGDADAACATPGFANNDLDCDDRDAAINPDAVDVPADPFDQDCDGAWACWADADLDGFGDAAGGIALSPNPACEQPGESSDQRDCDDADPLTNPDGTEVAGNSGDEDCDGTWLCWEDLDRDSYGTELGFTVVSADGVCTDLGESTNTEDCDDLRDAVHPGLTEVPGNTLDEDCDDVWLCWVDADGDGHGVDTTVPSFDGLCNGPGESADRADCDDADPAISPDAAEFPGNAVDEDCSGDWTCYDDADLDGFGGSGLRESADADCAGLGEDSEIRDCNDTDPDVSPAAVEIPSNLVDDDCDGTWSCWVDADRDSFGTADTTVISPDLFCNGPGEANDRNDCDDADATIRPGAPEVTADGVDQDCDGRFTCWADADLDSFGTAAATAESPNADCRSPGASPDTLDCDDADGATWPGAPENPGEGVDRDCDGDWACWADGDADLFGRNEVVEGTVRNCLGSGAARNRRDCDDTDPRINPDAYDAPADQIDQDCDGLDMCWVDADRDRYGSTRLAPGQCTDDGLSDNDDDCDDTDPAAWPGAPELPGDTVDQDCDGLYACFVDGDGDGVGVSTAWGLSTRADCDEPGLSPLGTDCDDTDPVIAPGLPDVPGNNIDEDCDGTWLCWADPDGDGAGDPRRTVISLDDDCTDPGEAPLPDDCSDDPAVHPGAGELCTLAGDPVDEDCDGLLDDADPDVSGAPVWLVDGDLDGFGGETPVAACLAPQGTTAVGGDCDDTNAAIRPGATELPANGVDEDCDGLYACYADGDLDGWGRAARADSTDPDCTDAGESVERSDCDDSDPSRHPGADDPPADGIDQDCDGLFTCWLDQDGDLHGNDEGRTIAASTPDCADPGASLLADDCDDANGTIYAGAPELPAGGVDRDCSGDWLCYEDADGDSWGNAGGVAVTSADVACDAPGESANARDCDDADPNIHPGAPEIAGNNIDEDCSGDWFCWSDADEDGHGTAPFIPSADALCTDPGESLLDDDCDDTRADVYPGAPEVPANGVDDDCDGLFACWLDADEDAYGNDDGLTLDGPDPRCAATRQSLTATDCDDADALIHPGSPEIALDGIDQDCDGFDLGAPVDTDVPAETDIPVETDLPETDVPGETDLPPETDVPGETDLPETDLPGETDLPPDTDTLPDTDVPETDLPADSDDSDPNTDTDLPDDTDGDNDKDPGLPEGTSWYAGGCQCGSSGGPGLAALGLLTVLVRRRRS